MANGLMADVYGGAGVEGGGISAAVAEVIHSLWLELVVCSFLMVVWVWRQRHNGSKTSTKSTTKTTATSSGNSSKAKQAAAGRPSPPSIPHLSAPSHPPSSKWSVAGAIRSTAATIINRFKKRTTAPPNAAAHDTTDEHQPADDQSPVARKRPDALLLASPSDGGLAKAMAEAVLREQTPWSPNAQVASKGHPQPPLAATSPLLGDFPPPPDGLFAPPTNQHQQWSGVFATSPSPSHAHTHAFATSSVHSVHSLSPFTSNTSPAPSSVVAQQHSPDLVVGSSGGGQHSGTATTMTTPSFFNGSFGIPATSSVTSSPAAVTNDGWAVSGGGGSGSGGGGSGDKGGYRKDKDHCSDDSSTHEQAFPELSAAASPTSTSPTFAKKDIVDESPVHQAIVYRRPGISRLPTEAPNDSPTLTTDHFPPLLPTSTATSATNGKRSSRGSFSSRHDSNEGTTHNSSHGGGSGAKSSTARRLSALTERLTSVGSTSAGETPTHRGSIDQGKMGGDTPSSGSASTSESRMRGEESTNGNGGNGGNGERGWGGARERWGNGGGGGGGGRGGGGGGGRVKGIVEMDNTVPFEELARDPMRLRGSIMDMCTKRYGRAIEYYKMAVRTGVYKHIRDEQMYVNLVQLGLFLGHRDLADSVLGDMKAASIPRPLNMYISIMKMFAARHLYSKCLWLYEAMREDGHAPRDATMYSCLLSAAVESGEFDKAIEFFKKLSNVGRPSIKAFMQVIRVHSRRNDWQAALNLLKQLCDSGMEPDNLIVNNVLATCVNARQVAVARTLLEEMKDTPGLLDTISYNTIIKGYAQSGAFESAMDILHDMREQGLQPNDISFNTLMDAAIRANASDAAWKILDEMQRSGINPDRYTCSILLKGISNEPNSHRGGRDHNRDRDRDSVNTPKSASRHPSNHPSTPTSNQQNNNNSANSSSSGSNRTNNASNGRRNNTHRQQQQHQPPPRSSGGRASSHWDEGGGGGGGRVGGTTWVPAAAANATNRTNSVQDSNSSSSRGGRPSAGGSGAGGGGSGVRAGRQSDEGEREHPKDPAVNDLDINGGDGGMREVSEILARLANNQMPPSAQSYGTIIKALGQAGQLDKCFVVWQDMTKNNISPTPLTYGILMDACVHCGETGKAYEVFQDMCSAGWAANDALYTTLIKGFVKAKDIDHALAVYQQMQAVPSPTTKQASGGGSPERGPRGDLLTYSMLIKATCDAQDLNTATQILKDMQSDGVAADELVLNSLLNACLKEQNVTLAQSVLNDLTQKGVVPSTLTLAIMIKLLTKCRMYVDALGLLREFKCDYGMAPGANNYNALIQACVRGHALCVALDAFDEFLCDANTAPPKCPRPDASTYVALLNGCVEATHSSNGGGGGAGQTPNGAGGMTTAKLTDTAVSLVERAYSEGLSLPEDSLTPLIKLASYTHTSEHLVSLMKKMGLPVSPEHAHARSATPPVMVVHPSDRDGHPMLPPIMAHNDVTATPC